MENLKEKKQIQVFKVKMGIFFDNKDTFVSIRCKALKDEKEGRCKPCWKKYK